MANNKVRHLPLAAIAAMLAALAIGTVPLATMIALAALMEALQ